MSRAIGQLEKMFRAINTDLFGGTLPTCIITVQSSPRSYGHSSARKIWQHKDQYTYEINIAAEALDMMIEEILDTLIHEMVHIYCRENNIKETSRGTSYHNRKFKEEAEKRLLVCCPCGAAGYNTTGANNDKLTAYAMEKNWNEIMLGRRTLPAPTPANQGNSQTEEQQPRTKNSSTRKLKCPRCGMAARTTKKTGKLICGNCYEETGEIHFMKEN